MRAFESHPSFPQVGWRSATDQVRGTHASWIVTSCVHSLSPLLSYSQHPSGNRSYSSLGSYSFFSMTNHSARLPALFREASFSIKIELDSIYLQCAALLQLLFIICRRHRVWPVILDFPVTASFFSPPTPFTLVVMHLIRSHYSRVRHNSIRYTLGHTWLPLTILGIYVLRYPSLERYTEDVSKYTRMYIHPNYPSPPEEEKIIIIKKAKGGGGKWYVSSNTVRPSFFFSCYFFLFLWEGGFFLFQPCLKLFRPWRQLTSKNCRFFVVGGKLILIEFVGIKNTAPVSRAVVIFYHWIVRRVIVIDCEEKK